MLPRWKGDPGYVSIEVQGCLKQYWYKWFYCSPEAIHRVAQAISEEVRAHWNENVKHRKYHTFYGLNCLGPTLDLMRHPLWGRNQVDAKHLWNFYGWCNYFIFTRYVINFRKRLERTRFSQGPLVQSMWVVCKEMIPDISE